MRQPLADYFTGNFWVAGSGTNSPRYLRWTAEVMGTDRMLYSTDYPFTYGFRPGGFPYVDTSNGAARSFLENSPFTDEQKADIGHRNWERPPPAPSTRPPEPPTGGGPGPGARCAPTPQVRRRAPVR
ncbi:hypothetical protein AB0L85_31265 [Streptomyces sp. NPDC052051]|uniref:hypothetical protein n=1 Tax=Streptomyces sp. NPDC052051 TaxID=3154649 RepID=UPI00343B5EB4